MREGKETGQTSLTWLFGDHRGSSTAVKWGPNEY